jgi:transaldolase/transaldolase/glucose-6-phosphate isomerase
MVGDAYDIEIAALAQTGKTTTEIYQTLAIEDVQGAADLLRPVFDRSGNTDGFISLEVSPLLARDTKGTVAEAIAFWARLNRPNVMIKIPATAEGLPAIEEAIAAGLNINVTLLFAVERYCAVAERYIAGLERLAASGGDITKTRSVASFFLSRIDTMVDPELKGPNAASLAGKTAIACAKHAYEDFEALFGGSRFAHLKAQGAHPQRLLWASTSTKNPAYPDTMYVEPLIGPETVNTMPLETIKAYLDHGKPASRIKDGLAEVHTTLHQLKDAGIDLGNIASRLEEEALKKFIDPYNTLTGVIEQKREAAAGQKAATR